MFGLDRVGFKLGWIEFGSIRVISGQFGSIRVSSGRLKSGQFGSGLFSLKVEGGNRKASKSGSGGEDSAFKQQIGGHGSRLDGRDFTWQQIAASLGSWQQQISEMRAAHDSRLDGFDLAAAGRDFTWQQQIVISAVGSNRSRLVVAGCRLAGCGLRLPCSVVSLFVFVFVICEVVADRQRCAACGFYSSMCAAAYVTMCVWLSGWQLPISTPKSAGGPAISSQPKTTWPPPSHVTLPLSSFGRARPTRSAGGARRKLWTGVAAAAQISSLTTVVRHVVDPRESQS
ncbi:hypothetical protein WN943_003500 [Citrus x changshan-huyou]